MIEKKTIICEWARGEGTQRTGGGGGFRKEPSHLGSLGEMVVGVHSEAGETEDAVAGACGSSLQARLLAEGKEARGGTCLRGEKKTRDGC